MKCKECNNDFDSELDLHRHIRSHKMHIAEYYHRYYPRYDLFTNELIVFKDKEYYFSHSFNDRNSFKSWWATMDIHIRRKYAIEFLQQRKEQKKLVYAPCQVELRSMYCPAIATCDVLFGDYYKLCYSMGYRVKYERFHVLSEVVKPDYSILIDSREQKPLDFEQPTKVATLSVGDYAYGKDGEALPVYFERKSLSDFIGSFGRDYDRVRREIERATLAGIRLIVIVEEDLKYALVFNAFVDKFIKATPEFVFHNVRKLCQEFANLQFLFVKNRREASRIIDKVFKHAGEHFKFDLQLTLDLGKL